MSDEPQLTAQAEAMGTAPMWRLLATMSGPPTLAIIVMALYSIVDRAFVGRAVGVDALSGLSAAFPAQLLAVGLGLLPGLGGMSVISRALGAHRSRLASRVLGSSLVIVLPLYLALVVLALTQLEPLLGLFGDIGHHGPPRPSISHHHPPRKPASHDRHVLQPVPHGRGPPRHRDDSYGRRSPA